MKLKKIIVVKFLALALTFLLAFVSSAHTTSQTNVVEGNGSMYSSCGWIIRETSHTNGTTVKYSFNPNDPYVGLASPNGVNYRSITNAGAAKWQQPFLSPFSVQHDQTATNFVVDTYYNSGSSTVAMFTLYNSNSSGHLTNWKISINRARNITSENMAHEFGHAFGLRDLYSSNNSNKLMYGYTTGTATVPITNDLNGAKVITGNHGPGTSNNHNFNLFSANPNLVPNTATHHLVSCSICLGERTDSNKYGTHIYNIYESASANVHTKRCSCGVHGGDAPHVWVGNVCSLCGRVR